MRPLTPGTPARIRRAAAFLGASAILACFLLPEFPWIEIRFGLPWLIRLPLLPVDLALRILGSEQTGPQLGLYEVAAAAIVLALAQLWNPRSAALFRLHHVAQMLFSGIPLSFLVQAWRTLPDPLIADVRLAIGFHGTLAAFALIFLMAAWGLLAGPAANDGRPPEPPPRR